SGTSSAVATERRPSSGGRPLPSSSGSPPPLVASRRRIFGDGWKEPASPRCARPAHWWPPCTCSSTLGRPAEVNPGSCSPRQPSPRRWLCTSSLVAEERFSFLARQRFLHHDALHPTRSKTICKYDELVKDSGNHARSAAQHCQSADPGDRSRLHHQHP